MTDKHARSSLSRRHLVGASLIAAATSLPIAGASEASPVPPVAARVNLQGRLVTIVDLTHQLTTEFNSPPSTPNATRLAMEPLQGSGAAVGMLMNRVLLIEHTGTHIDVPRHFSPTGLSLGEIPITDLVVPLAVIDIRERASRDRDAALMPQDVLAWEAVHGRLPPRCCVAIHAGWDFLTERKLQNARPPAERRKSPGFGPEVTRLLMEERDVRGMAVEAGTIDFGSNAPAYPVHQAWLRSGRWGIEGLTNLSEVPPSGALLIVGAAPMKDATGLPVRALALF